MSCWNEKCKYHNTGTCVTGIAKSRRECNKKLPEGAKIKVVLNGCGLDSTIAEAILRDEIEIQPNSILFIEGELLCTDNVLPVVQLEDDSFQINCYLQDAYTIRNGYFIGSAMESD